MNKHLAQINVARMRFSPGSLELAEFEAALDSVNQAAEHSPGFVWRLESPGGDDPALDAFEGRGWLVNMSLWETVDDLLRFVRSPLHLSIMRRRREWFDAVQTNMALWWVDAGHIPDFTEAKARLEKLGNDGPGADVFTFKEHSNK